MSAPSCSPTGRRWELGPVLDLSGYDVTSLAAVLGVNASTVQRRFAWKMSDIEANLCCCAAGVHPAEVYGSQWWRQALDDERERLAAQHAEQLTLDLAVA